jgi:hypothetical protein
MFSLKAQDQSSHKITLKSVVFVSDYTPRVSAVKGHHQVTYTDWLETSVLWMQIC